PARPRRRHRAKHRRDARGPVPVDNAFIESFNGRLRDECLNTNWFYGLEQARDVIGAWLRTTTSIDRTAPLPGSRRSSTKGKFGHRRWTEEGGHVRRSVRDVCA